MVLTGRRSKFARNLNGDLVKENRGSVCRARERDQGNAVVGGYEDKVDCRKCCKTGGDIVGIEMGEKRQERGGEAATLGCRRNLFPRMLRPEEEDRKLDFRRSNTIRR